MSGWAYIRVGLCPRGSLSTIENFQGKRHHLYITYHKQSLIIFDPDPSLSAQFYLLQVKLTVVPTFGDPNRHTFDAGIICE